MGGAAGSRHPEFTLWIFPRTVDNTPEHFEETIRNHQQVQSDIPTVLGASESYILTAIGDIDEGETQIINLAKALHITLKGIQ